MFDYELMTTNFPDTFTNPEQVKRLLAIGVPEDSADMYMFEEGDNHRPFTIYPMSCYSEVAASNALYGNKTLPCWSVGQLLKVFNYCVGTAVDRMMIIQNMQLYYILDFAEAYTMTFEILNNHHQIDFSRFEKK